MEGKSEASDFELKIQNFLKKMKFENVNGGLAFTIGGIQVDACGGHEDTLLAIEATTQRKSLRNKLKELKGVIPSLESGFKKHDTYSSYRKYKFILATSHKNISETDEKFAQSTPFVYLWNNQLIEYYLQLHNSIKEFAKYNLLGEMNVNPLSEGHIIIPSFKTQINNNVLYNFYLDPKTLLKTSYVARREIGKEKYYQRMVDKDRLGRIAEYIDEENGMFPNNIIICFEKPPEFIRKKDVETSMSDNWPNWLQFGFLKFPKHYRSTWIIDGQHRLYAFARTKENSRLPVIAFHSLEEEKQAGFFIDINKEQKPIERNLLWDLDGQMRPQSKEGMISNVVRELNKIEPLKNLVYIPLEGAGKRGKLKLTSLCTAIKKRKLVDVTTESKVENPYHVATDYRETVKKVAQNIGRFLAIVQKEFSGRIIQKFIFTNGGFSVIITIFERIIARKKTDPSDDDFRNYLFPVKEHLELKTDKEINDLRIKCSSEAGKQAVYEELGLKIRRFDDKFDENIEIAYSAEIGSFEKTLREFIAGILEKKNPNWLKEDIPADVYRMANGRKEKKQGKKAEDFFDIGQCIEIIQNRRNKEVFESIFIKTQEGFLTAEEFYGALRKIKHYRDDIVHKREPDFKFGDEDLLNIYLEKVNKCIERYNQKV